MGKVINLFERRMEKEAAKIIDKDITKITEEKVTRMRKGGEIPFTADDQKEIKRVSDVLDSVNEEVDTSMFKGKKGPIEGPIEDIKNQQRAEQQKFEDLLSNIRNQEYNPATGMSDSKVKITRYNGKTSNVKSPISKEFMEARNAEASKVTGKNSKLTMSSGAQDTPEAAEVLNNLSNGKFKNDAIKLKNLSKSSSDLRAKVKAGNVEFDAGTVAAKKEGGKMDSFLKKAIPTAVGGGLVLSMFSRGGQMSNSELYGQQQQYGGGY